MLGIREVRLRHSRVLHPVLNPLHSLFVRLKNIRVEDEGVSSGELESGSDDVVRTSLFPHFLTHGDEAEAEELLQLFPRQSRELEEDAVQSK